MSESRRNRLRHKAPKIKPLLELDGVWTVHDVRATEATETMRPTDWVTWLKHVDAIESVDKVHNGNWSIRKWQWKPAAKDYLKQCVDRDNTLPCGCRPHIPDMRDSPNGVGQCKFCKQEHDRETFKEVL